MPRAAELQRPHTPQATPPCMPHPTSLYGRSPGDVPSDDPRQLRQPGPPVPVIQRLACRHLDQAGGRVERVALVEGATQPGGKQRAHGAAGRGMGSGGSWWGGAPAPQPEGGQSMAGWAGGAAGLGAARWSVGEGCPPTVPAQRCTPLAAPGRAADDYHDGLVSHAVDQGTAARRVLTSQEWWHHPQRYLSNFRLQFLVFLTPAG